jgi:hypothetical protein
MQLIDRAIKALYHEAFAHCITLTLYRAYTSSSLLCPHRDAELAELTSALLAERAAEPQDSYAWRREAAKWQQRIAALTLQLSTEQEDAAAVKSELTARALRAEAAATALTQEATLWEARGRQLLLCEAELAKVCHVLCVL